jgi:hypothetical protein
MGTLVGLEQALRQKICGVCIDRNVDGICSLDESGECSLFAKFPRIAASIGRVQSDHLDDYVTAIRQDVCANCVEQEDDGTCKQRDQGICVLDRYLAFIVDVIEEARGVPLQSGAR